MKLCIPALGSNGLTAEVGAHFGRVPYYAVYDTETGKVDVVPNTSEHTGGVGTPPEQIIGTGSKVLICGGLGRKAVDIFYANGIEVFVGANGTVEAAIEAYKRGELESADSSNACNHGH